MVLARVLDEKTGEMLWSQEFKELPQKGVALAYENVLLYGFIGKASNTFELAYIDLDSSKLQSLDVALDVDKISSLVWIKPSSKSILFQLDKNRDYVIAALKLSYKKENI